MSNQPGPWLNQPAEPTAAAPGWTQPGPAVPGPAPAGYGPAPAGHGGPAPGYAPGPTAYGPPPGYPAAPGYAVPLRTDYASWGKRVGAMLIDQAPSYVGLIIFNVGYFVWLIRLTTTTGSGTPDFSAGAVPMIVGSVIMLAGFGWTIYNRWLVAGRTGQSLGKRITKISLISESTNAPIGPMNAFLRDLVHILDGAAYVGYLWPLWDDKKQTFSDKIMLTIVVNSS